MGDEKYVKFLKESADAMDKELSDKEYNEGFVQGWIGCALVLRPGKGMTDAQVIEWAEEQAECSGNMRKIVPPVSLPTKTTVN
jgi:hypothetical protein